MEFIQALGLSIIFGSILFLAYVTTRFVGKKSKNSISGKYISIVETVSLGMDKQLHLVRVDRQFILIATSGKNVEFLTKLRMEDYDFDSVEHDNDNGFAFKKVFENYLKLYKDKHNSKDRSRDEEEKPVMNKEVYSLKRNLEKLKSINNGAYIKDEKNWNDNIDEE